MLRLPWQVLFPLAGVRPYAGYIRQHWHTVQIACRAKSPREIEQTILNFLHRRESGVSVTSRR